MKVYLADRDPQHHSWAKGGTDRAKLKLKILLSYHYYKDTDLDALFAKYFTEPYPEVFADSGAFSAMTQGANIDIHEYARWIKSWRHLFSTYANIDVIGDAEATRENQKELEVMGLHPLPVFHTGEDWAYLEWYLERYAYIALGGMVPYMRFPKKIMPWLIQAFKRAKGRAVYHGFGATAWTIIKSLPWYSVDSSSWGQGFRFGNVPLFDERRGRFVKISLGDRKSCYKHGALLKRMGFDPEDFADRERNDRAKICAVSALSYIKAEQWLQGFHGEIRIPKRDDVSAALRIHIADANPKRFVDAVQGAGVHLHLADTSNGINFGDADAGIKIHLVEHSLDRGGVGDTSRAMEILGK